MTKYLIVTMPNLSRWRIPADFIARHRATYYADFYKEENTTYQELYDAEYELVMADDFELTDWASNNMDWSDVVVVAERLDDEEFDYQEAWRSGPRMRVVEE
jgi:hypothetical protein